MTVNFNISPDVTNACKGKSGVRVCTIFEACDFGNLNVTLTLKTVRR